MPLQAQQQQLERAEAVFQHSAGRLRQMQQHLAGQGGADVDAARVLEILQDDVARMRALVCGTGQITSVLAAWHGLSAPDV